MSAQFCDAWTDLKVESYGGDIGLMRQNVQSIYILLPCRHEESESAVPNRDFLKSEE